MIRNLLLLFIFLAFCAFIDVSPKFNIRIDKSAISDIDSLCILYGSKSARPVCVKVREYNYRFSDRTSVFFLRLKLNDSTSVLSDSIKVIWAKTNVLILRDKNKFIFKELPISRIPGLLIIIVIIVGFVFILSLVKKGYA
jgi:hypothetical protein